MQWQYIIAFYFTYIKIHPLITENEPTHKKAPFIYHLLTAKTLISMRSLRRLIGVFPVRIHRKTKTNQL